MITKAKVLKLISIYLYICDICDSKLRNACERFSNNSYPDFTDQEVITIYLSLCNEHRTTIKDKANIRFCKRPSSFVVSIIATYEAFIMRINRLSEAFRNLADVLLSGYCPKDCDLNASLMDSLPIISFSGKRFICCKRDNRSGILLN